MTISPSIIKAKVDPASLPPEVFQYLSLYSSTEALINSTLVKKSWRDLLSGSTQWRALDLSQFQVSSSRILQLIQLFTDRSGCKVENLRLELTDCFGSRDALPTVLRSVIDILKLSRDWVKHVELTLETGVNGISLVLWVLRSLAVFEKSSFVKIKANLPFSATSESSNPEERKRKVALQSLSQFFYSHSSVSSPSDESLQLLVELTQFARGDLTTFECSDLSSLTLPISEGRLVEELRGSVYDLQKLGFKGQVNTSSLEGISELIISASSQNLKSLLISVNHVENYDSEFQFKIPEELGVVNLREVELDSTNMRINWDASLMEWLGKVEILKLKGSSAGIPFGWVEAYLKGDTPGLRSLRLTSINSERSDVLPSNFNLPLLQHLSVSDMMLGGSEDTSKFLNSFHCPKLESLSLIKVDGPSSIGIFIKNCPMIKRINYSPMVPSSSQVEEEGGISKDLTSCSWRFLEELRLDIYPFPIRMVSELKERTHFQNLKSLEVSNFSFEDHASGLVELMMRRRTWGLLEVLLPGTLFGEIEELKELMEENWTEEEGSEMRIRVTNQPGKIWWV